MSKRILDFCSISGEAVKKYNGRKKYIATGDIIDNKINSYTEVEFSNKPSRANQIAKVGDVLFAKMKNTQKVISINEENVVAKDIFEFEKEEEQKKTFGQYFVLPVTSKRSPRTAAAVRGLLLQILVIQARTAA